MKMFLNYIIDLFLKTFNKKKYYERSPSNAIKPYMKRAYKRINQNEVLVTPYTDGVTSYAGNLTKKSISIKDLKERIENENKGRKESKLEDSLFK